MFIENETMTNVLIVILVLYNMWLVFCLLHWREPKKRTARPEPSWKPETDTDIVGKSLFRMPGGRTTGDIPAPQAASHVEGEAVAPDDVTFAGENGARHSMRLPDDRLEEAFSDTRLSDVPVEYADGDDEQTGEYASGATIEEMNEAIRTADNPEATDTEKMKAGEVFHEMEGNGLYEILTAKTPGIVSRIKGLIDLYENSQTVIPTGSKGTVQVSIDDFDIRDFV